MGTLWAIVVGVLIVNLPFGFWREGLRRFSVPWFVAVHLPVPLVVGLRLSADLGWRLATFPLFVVAYCAGQYLGGALRRRIRDTHQTGLD